MRRLRTLVSTSVALLVVTAPGLASAYYSFPGFVQTHLALAYTPPCTICHATTAGGPPDTIVHPFGEAMLGQGLTPGSVQTDVSAALDALEAAMTDSDCNGILDPDQLKDGRDPNPPGEYIDGSSKPTPMDEPAGGCTTALPSVLYGCGARLSPALPSWQGAAALVTALGLVLSRARARRRAR